MARVAILLKRQSLRAIQPKSFGPRTTESRHTLGDSPNLLDLVLIHSNGDDLAILDETDAVETLLDLKARGVVKAIGLSGKTVEGARQSLDWADAVMVEYHLNDRSHESLIGEAAQRGT